MKPENIAISLSLIILTGCQYAFGKASASENYRTLSQSYKIEYEKFQNGLRTKKTDKEFQKAFDSEPTLKYSIKMAELMKANPDDPAAEDAAIWLMLNAWHTSKADTQRIAACKFLNERHSKSAKLDEVVPHLRYLNDQASADFLRKVIKENPSSKIRGLACLALGCRLADSPGAALLELPVKEDSRASEARSLLKEARDKYGSIEYREGKVSALASAQLYELDYLMPGKKAPEIEGEDVNGKKLKLSSYKGKVILLSYFGDW